MSISPVAENPDPSVRGLSPSHPPRRPKFHFFGQKIDGFYKSNHFNFRSVSESHTQALGTMIFLIK